MYCWSCGEALPRTEGRCPSCGAAPALPEREPRGRPVRTCPACGYRGDGMPYFRRAGHAILLVGATVFTYGIGGLAYWLLKRHDRICPSCGLSWGRVHLSPANGNRALEASGPRSDEAVSRRGGGNEVLPPSGAGRRVTGVVLGLLALLLLGGGIVEGELAMIMTSVVMAVAGSATFVWGSRALQQRREAVLRGLQRRVLHLARERGGRLTATDVASELDLSLSGGERVLLSLDDGFRIRSDVTDEGLLVFDFPEIRLQSGREEAGEQGNDLPPAPETPGTP